MMTTKDDIESQDQNLTLDLLAEAVDLLKSFEDNQAVAAFLAKIANPEPLPLAPIAGRVKQQTFPNGDIFLTFDTGTGLSSSAHITAAEIEACPDGEAIAELIRTASAPAMKLLGAELENFTVIEPDGSRDA